MTLPESYHFVQNQKEKSCFFYIAKTVKESTVVHFLHCWRAGACRQQRRVTHGILEQSFSDAIFKDKLCSLVISIWLKLWSWFLLKYIYGHSFTNNPNFLASEIRFTPSKHSRNEEILLAHVTAKFTDSKPSINILKVP